MRYPTALVAVLSITSAFAAMAAQIEVTPNLQPMPVAADRVLLSQFALSEARIDGGLVVYADRDPSGWTRLHVFDVRTESDAAIPISGFEDRYIDIQGRRIVWSEPAGPAEQVFLFELGGTTAAEIAPFTNTPGPNAWDYREHPSIGGLTVAWEERSLWLASSEIMVHNLSDGTTEQLTNDAAWDAQPAVSADGSLVVWSKTAADYTAEPWKAVKIGNAWLVMRLASGFGEVSGMGTDGETIAYVGDATRGNGTVAWQAATGGPEYRLGQVGGPAYKAVIDDGVIVFYAVTGPLPETPPTMWAYDIHTNKLYPLPGSLLEGPTDVEVLPNGNVYVTYIGGTGPALETHLMSFHIARGDDHPPSITCPGDIDVPADAMACSAVVHYDIRVTDDQPGVDLSVSLPSGSAFPVGTTAVTATATDAAGNRSSCSFNVNVSDTQKPVIADLSVDKPVLWPPNRKMVDVTVGYSITDNCGVARTSVTVSSNEGNSSDWEIVNDHLVRLRADRDGRGSGRRYTIEIAAVDVHGNASVRRIEVTVPKSAP